jgi:ribonuclease HI
VAELWGVLEGLSYAWRLRFRKVELQLDSKQVVDMVTKKVGVQHDGWSLCQKIWRLLHLNWEVRIRHTYREANLCADALASIGCGVGNTMIFYESCPTQIRQLFIADAAGTNVSRLVVM